MAHDFEKFPELTDSQLNFYYYASPHKQIFDDFRAKVVAVHDGDTITVKTDFRDFPFKVRSSNIDTKEMSAGGAEARDWLRGKILEKEVTIQVDRDNRVGKYGRLIGETLFQGMSMSDELQGLMLATEYARKGEGVIKELESILASSTVGTIAEALA